MTDNTIRVRIIAADADTIHIVPVDDIRECRRCAEGEGCGNRPWFRGFFRNGSIALPNREQWKTSETADLSLSSSGLNYSAFLTYGLPLAAFILALIASQALPEPLQLLIACLALAAAILVARPLCHHIIRRHLRLERRHARAAVIKVANGECTIQVPEP